LGTITILSATPNCNSKQYTFTNTVTLDSAANGYLVKYNENLRLCRAVQFGGTTVTLLNVNDADVDEQGNVYFVGSFDGTAQFGTKSYAGPSLFLAKYSKDLKFCKIALISNPEVGTVNAVSVKGDDVYVTGDFTGTLVFNGKTTITSPLLQSGFFAKYSQKKLKLKFVSTFHAGISMSPSDINVDSSDNAYIVGFFEGLTATFGCVTLTGSTTYQTAFAVKAVGEKPKLRARLCCNGIQGKKIRNPFSNFEVMKVKVEKHKKLIPSLNYYATYSDPKIIRASSDTCSCAHCCKNQCGKKECAQYVGTAAGRNCILVCASKPVVQEAEAVQMLQQQQQGYGGW
jgi:hypothetical protein